MRLLFTILIGISVAISATINVPADQATIQEGINAASDGDFVLVAPGTYVENINFNGKNITVLSTYIPGVSVDGSIIESTIIDGNNDGSTVVFNHNESSSASLRGFTIKNGYAFNGGGIYIQGADPSFQDLIIAENNAYFSGAGVYCIGSNSSFSSVTISKNEAGDYAGAIDKVNSNISFLNSIIWDNLPESIVSNTFSVTYSDIEWTDDPVYPGSNNINADPLFVDSTFPIYLFNLGGDSPCIDTGFGTDVYGTNNEMGAMVFGPTSGCMDPNAYNYDSGATVPLECEYQPVANDMDITVAEDIPQTITFDVTDGDGADDVLTYSVVIDSSNHGTLGPITYNGNIGSFLFTPDQDYNGFGFISYSVEDDSNPLMPDGSFAGALSDSGLITLEMTPVNDPPQITAIDTLDMTFNEPYNLIINIVDVDDDAFTFLVETTSSYLEINTDDFPLIIITPTAFWGGLGDIAVTIWDSGNASDFEEFTVRHLPLGDYATLSFGQIDYTNHVIPIMMDNPMPIAGFEFQVSPENITLSSVYGGRVEDAFWLNNVQLLNEIVLGYLTINLDPIPPSAPGDTAFTYLSWNQGDWFGDPEICIDNVVLSDTLAQNIVAVIDTCVTYPYFSDVDQSGVIDVLDIVGVVDFILGNSAPNAFQSWAADSNEDGGIDVVDLVYIVQVILGNIVPREALLTSSEISYQGNEFLLSNAHNIAALELGYTGNLKITHDYLPDSWEIHQSKDKLVIFNFGTEPLTSDHLFDFDGSFQITSNLVAGYDGESVIADVIGLPLTYALNPAYPNPFNPVTSIHYSIQTDTDVEIVIYDILGNQVDKLVDGRQNAGNYSINWNAGGFAAGVYLVKMTAPEFVQTQKLILLK